MAKHEESLQIAVCNYLKLQFPPVIFMSDVASGMKLSIGQAVRAKKMRSSRGMPDLFIAEAKNNYHGLFIELKKEGTKIFLKDGCTLVSDSHIIEQYEILKYLERKGYKALFGIGFDRCKIIIDEYLNFRG